ncbi:MAG: hypothetical protein JWP09_560 [Candidatus Taylorbacteria bacterium]|nr:hypothetical protein [Candidatus Taylorbacteria bacterium]
MKEELEQHFKEILEIRAREECLKKRIGEIRDLLTVKDVDTFPANFETFRFTISNGKELTLLKTFVGKASLLTDVSTCKCTYSLLKVTHGLGSINFKVWYACRRDLGISDDINAWKVAHEIALFAKSKGVERVYTGTIIQDKSLELSDVRMINCSSSEPQYMVFCDEKEEWNSIHDNHPYLGLGGQLRSLIYRTIQ